MELTPTTPTIRRPTLEPLPTEAIHNERVERWLLILGGVFIVVNYTALMLVRANTDLLQWLPLLVWMICAVVGYKLLKRYLPIHDPLLYPLAMFLSGWGLVMIERLAPLFADRQTIWLMVSLAAMLVIAVQPHLLRWLKTYRYLLLIGGLILLISTIGFGTNPSGEPGAPRLWLGFPGFYFQPSEALKIILVAFLASYLAEQYPIMRAEGSEGDQRRLSFSPRILGPILLMWSISVIILVWQRDLGTAMLFFLVFMLLLYVASGYTLILVSGGVLTLAAGFVAYQAFGVVQLRIDIWLNPWLDADGRAYQIVQSLMAFGAGGVFGQGVGQGIPTFIPVVHSDFVFAAVAEEWGLLGIITVIVCFVLLVSRGLRISLMHPDNPFHVLFAVGLTLIIAVQSLLIMGGVLKLVPLTGVTLPFVSYGGSSLLIMFVIIGLLLRLSTHE